MISKDENQMWASTRYFFLNEDNSLDEATIVASMNEKELIPLIRLKSEQDNSYPGMVLEEDGSLSILYYSSKSEGESNIYITRIAFS